MLMRNGTVAVRWLWMQSGFSKRVAERPGSGRI
jgi:hypothetical protein